MFDRKYFETFVTEHAGKFAEQHRVPSPRIDVVLRDTTNRARAARDPFLPSPDFRGNAVVVGEPAFSLFPPLPYPECRYSHPDPTRRVTWTADFERHGTLSGRRTMF
jgi:hypothetical protein